MHNIYAGCHMLLFSRFTAIPCLSLQAVKHTYPCPRGTAPVLSKTATAPAPIFYFVKKKQKITKNHTQTRMM